MSQKYALYHTLNKNIKSTALPAKHKKQLLETLNNLTDEDKQKAVFMLITEHFRVTEQETLDPANFDIPYEGTQTKAGVTFDIDSLPTELVWVLWKFVSAFAV